MTPDEFALYAYPPRCRLGDRGREAARLVLCEGVSAAEAGRQVGVTKAAVRGYVARVLREYRAARNAPRVWVAVTVVVPPGAEDEIRDIEKRERRAAGLLVD